MVYYRILYENVSKLLIVSHMHITLVRVATLHNVPIIEGNVAPGITP